MVRAMPRQLVLARHSSNFMLKMSQHTVFIFFRAENSISGDNISVIYFERPRAYKDHPEVESAEIDRARARVRGTIRAIMQSEVTRSVHTISVGCPNNMSKMALLQACEVLTRTMITGQCASEDDPKFYPDEVALSCLKVLNKRVFCEDKVQTGRSRSPEELRELARVVFSAAELKRCMHARSSAPSLPPSASPGDEPATCVSAFELHRVNLVNMLASHLAGFLHKYAEGFERQGAVLSAREGAFTVACLEIWAFYAQCSQEAGDFEFSDPEKRAWRAHESRFMKLAARTLSRLLHISKSRDASQTSTWKWKTFCVSLYRIQVALFDIGPKFIDQFFSVESIGSHWPVQIVNIFCPAPNLMQNTLSDIITRAMESYVRGRMGDNKGPTGMHWPSVFGSCFEADSIAHRNGLYTASSACVKFALDMFARDQIKKGSPALSHAEASAMILWFRPNENTVIEREMARSVSIAILSTHGIMKALFSLKWEHVYLTMLWKAITELDLIRSATQAINFDVLGMIGFYDTHAARSDVHKGAALEATQSQGQECGWANRVMNENEPDPNWTCIARMGMRAWSVYNAPIPSAPSPSAGIEFGLLCNRLGDIQFTCAVRSTLSATSSISGPGHTSWVCAAYNLAPLVLGSVKNASRMGYAWKTPVVRTAAQSTRAALAMWECPSVFEFTGTPEQHQMIRSHMIDIGLYVAETANIVLRSSRRALYSMCQVGCQDNLDLEKYMRRLHRAVRIHGFSDANHLKLIRNLSAFAHEEKKPTLAPELPRMVTPSIFRSRYRPGQMDVEFAVQLIESAASQFDPSSAHTKSALSFFPEAVVQVLKSRRHNGAARTASILCARIIRELGP